MYYQNYNNRGNGLWVFLILFILFGGFRLFFILFGLAVAILINFFPFILAGSIIYMISKRMRKNNTVNSTLNTHSTEHKRFVELMVHILIHVIKADGRVDPREIETLKQFFQQILGFNHSQIIWVEDTIQHSLKANYELTELCEEFSQNFRDDGKRMLIEMMYRISFSDGALHPNEDKLIFKVVGLLGVSKSEHEHIRVLYVKEEDRLKYYKILEVSEGASKDEIKKAYRNASKKYHPDKVHHLGDEFKKVAEEKMQHINEAYKVLSKG